MKPEETKAEMNDEPVCHGGGKGIDGGMSTELRSLESFPVSAKPFYKAHRDWLSDMDRHALELLAMNLLLKRDADGMNGRTWDNNQHLFFEELIAEELQRAPTKP